MINIADKIWAVKAVGRDNLAYMCPYNLKRDGTPDKATEKMMNTGQTWANVGPRALYRTADGGTTTNYYQADVVKEMIDGWERPVSAGQTEPERGVSAVYDNVPMRGFKVGQDATRWTTDNKVFRLHDPRGFTVEIPTGNLSTLIQSCTIINGEIMDECVWGRDGCHILLPINAPEYTKVVKEITAVEEALKLKDLKPGDWVKIHSGGKEQGERQFVGMVKLEWTQHRQLFDRIIDPDNRGYSYYTNFIAVNFRDDGTEVIRDPQWVGLFASETITTRTEVGRHHGNQPKYEYSEKEPSLTTENNTVKITSRRSGVLPECYKDLNKMLAVVSYSYYENRPSGRSDCPQRVHAKFAKQEITGYNNTRKAAKDLTRDHFTATVYQESDYK
jgi:hypothetical protein